MGSRPRSLIVTALVFGSLPFIGRMSAAPAEPPRGSITIARIAEIKFPTNPAWSPDGATVAFLWDAAGKQDLFVVRPGQAPVALTDFPVNPDTLQSDIGALDWVSADQVVFVKDGQLWTASASRHEAARIPGFTLEGAFALSSDKKQIAFVRQGQVMVASLTARRPEALTRLRDGLRPSALRFSRDDRYISFSVSRSWTEPEPLPFNGTRIQSFSNVTADRRMGLVSTSGGEPVWISTMGDATAVGWTADGSIVFDEISPDRKTHAVRTASRDGIVTTLWQDYDPAWWSPTRGPATKVSPDGKLVAFFSDRTGWTHLYVTSGAAKSSAEARQLTSGPFTVGYPAWSPDSARIAYAHGLPGNQMERLLSVVDVQSGKSEPIVESRGVHIEPATLIAHRSLDRTRKHPAIVWIHGSGSDQNYLGWHPGSYRMYYSVHQYLAQQGYIILTPDYRGSSGYDRDWATGNHLDLGGKDLLDVASGADYLASLGYVDPDRIGVWGLSYGGFMTLQAVTVTPTLFRCAIDVAGVTDWAPRGGGWTVARMGTPPQHPEEFHRSAPVKHMEHLIRPLLILHGTNDTNVAFHDSLALIDTLVKLGKPFETAIYPGEPHFFRRAHVLRDAWRRAEEFFDRHLKTERTPASP
jgi:dipeptidyl aminopeptidase/acylaminoacyl peptidase